MHVVLDNFPWMTFNVMLALLGVVFGWLVFVARTKIQKILWLVLWIFFAPNAVYLITDFIHLPEQLPEVEGLAVIVLIVQYIILEALGIIMFIASLYPIEKMLLRSLFRKNKPFSLGIIVLINFLIAFGVGLGRVQRTNSWDVLIQPDKVISDILQIFNSHQSLVFIVAFALITNSLYFSLRRITIDIVYKFLYSKKYNNKNRFF